MTGDGLQVVGGSWVLFAGVISLEVKMRGGGRDGGLLTGSAVPRRSSQAWSALSSSLGGGGAEWH